MFLKKEGVKEKKGKYGEMFLVENMLFIFKNYLQFHRIFKKLIKIRV